MISNQQLIEHFYTCFQRKDISGMQSCYAKVVTFSDPVFQKLNCKEVCSMWEMLITTGKDLTLTFDGIVSEGNKVKANWVASYTFSATGRRVINRVEARFIIHEGKIILHEDQFNFHTWAKQALGFSGWLLGWSDFLKSKVSKQAREKLNKYMAKQSN